MRLLMVWTGFYMALPKTISVSAATISSSGSESGQIQSSIISSIQSGSCTAAAFPRARPSSTKEATLLLDGKTRVRINHDHELMTSLAAWKEEIRRKMFAAAGEIQH